MNKEKVVEMMLESFENDNFQMALQYGMAEAEIKEKFENSKHSISFMLGNIYDLLESNNIIKND